MSAEVDADDIEVVGVDAFIAGYVIYYIIDGASVHALFGTDGGVVFFVNFHVAVDVSTEQFTVF